MAFEAEALLEDLRFPKSPGFALTAGTLFGKKVVHIASGMGIANAARAATVLMERFAPRLIVLFGIGGAYPSAGLGRGDIAVAEREVYADSGVLMGDGLHGMEETGIALVTKGRRKFFNEFPLEGKLARRALRAASLVAEARTGVFLTVAQATGTLGRARQLERRYGALCENMEGAAVAQVCALYGLPLVEMRGISNVVEDRDTGKWDRPLAALNCQRAVTRLLEET
jgi:futalosine hydrolase